MSTTDLPGSGLLAGRYRLVERLGAGGMSVVWRGFDEVLGRQVAVKVLPPSTSADPSFRRRLRAEAQAAARLTHPNITNVYDYGEATTVDGEPVPYVVMELVDGESLAAVLARVRMLNWPTTVRVGAEVAAALAAAHSRGIVHRDVTPANVMLTPSGAKVVDFGISALIGENDTDPDGSLLGTPAYLAPERLEGGQVSPATDVYAVGLLIYRMLIGQLPWDVGTTTALLRAHQYVEPEPLPPVDGLPPAVDALIRRCLEKRPQDRPSSAELAHVLAGVSASAPLITSGFDADWEDGEDTFILPSGYPYAGFGPAAAATGLSEAGTVNTDAATDPDAVHPVVAGAATEIAAGRPTDLASAPPAGVRPYAVPSAAAGALSADMSSGAGTAGGGFGVPSGAVGAGVPSGMVGGPSAAGLSSGAAGVPFGSPGVPSAGIPSAGAPSSGAPSSGAPFAGAPFAGAPSSGAPFAGAPFAGAPSSGAPFALRPGAGGPLAESPPTKPSGTRNQTRLRRVLVVAGTVALLSALTYGWTAVGQDRDDQAVGATNGPLPSAVPVSQQCVVSYAVWSDQGDKFKAQVTLANRDDEPINEWSLWFLMPGDQVVSGRGKIDLTQQDRAVKVTSAAALESQRTTTLQITGRYQESNAAPMVFKLNDQTCETYVSSEPGEPSRLVVHLADGRVRLGDPDATPTTGVSIAPGGGIVIIPTTTQPPTATPTGGNPTTTSTPTGNATTTTSPTPTATSQSPVEPSLPPSVGPSVDPVIDPTKTTLPPLPPPPSLEDCDPADCG